MRWTSRDEKEILKQWAKEDSTKEITESILSAKNENLVTYWEEFHNEDNIEEYDFETIPQLNEVLHNKLQNAYYQDIVLPVAVGIMKNNISTEVKERQEALESADFKIPDYVYVF